MSRAVTTVLAAALAVSACSQPQRRDFGEDGWGLPEGVIREPPPSTRPPAPRAKPIAEADRKPWQQAAALGVMRQVGGRGVSEHLGGRFERSVLVNELAAAYPRLSAGQTLPPGAMIVQRHHLEGSDEVAMYFVMTKLATDAAPTAADWRFLVVDSKLRVAAHTKLEACARCHMDAPREAVFGPPQ